VYYGVHVLAAVFFILTKSLGIIKRVRESLQTRYLHVAYLSFLHNFLHSFISELSEYTFLETCYEDVHCDVSHVFTT